MQLISSFVVPRDRWQRGRISSLLSGSGIPDIVGYWLLASGISEEELADRQELREVERRFAFPLPDHAYEMLDLIYEVNDAVQLSPSTRERLLVLLFTQLGVEVQFREHA